MIQDHLGQWFAGFSSNIGSCDSLTAEFWAICQGLQLAWNEGSRNLCLEIDLIEAYRHLTSVEKSNRSQSIVCFWC